MKSDSVRDEHQYESSKRGKLIAAKKRRGNKEEALWQKEQVAGLESSDPTPVSKSEMAALPPTVAKHVASVKGLLRDLGLSNEQAESELLGLRAIENATSQLGYETDTPELDEFLRWSSPVASLFSASAGLH